ncbi:MAG: AsmA family protein, partial [Marinobacter sp.]
MKAVRYVALAIVGLLILAVAAVAIAVAVIDPNTYKPQIEKVVESKTNLDLILAGDIGWSFIPLGLELNDVEATLEDERLVKLDQLVAQVSFWSLVTMSPRVDTFLLSGLDANLSVDANGTGNWTRIMPEGEEQPQQEEPATPAETAEEQPESSGASEPLNFNVESVEISNARVHYEDKGTGQAFTLEDFT